MQLSRLLRLGLAAALSVAFLAACGDDDDSGSSDDAIGIDDDGVETTDDGLDDGVDDGVDDEADDQPVDGVEDANTAAVTDAYTTFFSNFSGDVDLLEDGESFDPAVMDGLRANAEATGSIEVAVQSVTTLDDGGCEEAAMAAPCAEVVFDLVVNGEVVVPGSTGYAVEEEGAWKVAKATFCGLAGLQGGAPEGC